MPACARWRVSACGCKTREQDLEREKTRLAAEGKKEQQAKIREMEKKLESVLRDFEYHAREAVNAIQDKAAAQKAFKRCGAAHRQTAAGISRAVRFHRGGARQRSR